MQGGVVCDEMTVCLLECNPKYMPSIIFQPTSTTDRPTIFHEVLGSDYGECLSQVRKQSWP